MEKLKYSMLNDDWEVNEDTNTFISPPGEKRPGQIVIFGDRVPNGSIAADITILKSEENRRGRKSNEASLIVRYGGPEQAYYGGTGAFDTKFFIAKTLPGPIYQLRASVGESDSVIENKKYHLRIEFSGSRITFFENEVQQLSMVDESYQIGQCGLATWRTQAKFENIDIIKETPKAFVIMPFASELDFVHQVIETTVKKYGIICERADQIHISRPIMEDVKTKIAGADLVIVDFTGKNPNVYYEAGLADACNKNWIILAQSSEDMTFDVRHIRSIRYSNTMGANVKLEKDLSMALEALGYEVHEEISARSDKEKTWKSRKKQLIT